MALNQILADEINIGFQHLSNTSVVSVNDTRPRNMSHFVELVENADGLLKVKLSDDCLAAFDTSEARKANARILDRYHIGRDRSANLG